MLYDKAAEFPIVAKNAGNHRKACIVPFASIPIRNDVAERCETEFARIGTRRKFRVPAEKTDERLRDFRHAGLVSSVLAGPFEKVGGRRMGTGHEPKPPPPPSLGKASSNPNFGFHVFIGRLRQTSTRATGLMATDQLRYQILRQELPKSSTQEQLPFIMFVFCSAKERTDTLSQSERRSTSRSTKRKLKQQLSRAPGV